MRVDLDSPQRRSWIEYEEKLMAVNVKLARVEEILKKLGAEELLKKLGTEELKTSDEPMSGSLNTLRPG